MACRDGKTAKCMFGLQVPFRLNHTVEGWTRGGGRGGAQAGRIQRRGLKRRRRKCRTGSPRTASVRDALLLLFGHVPDHEMVVRDVDSGMSRVEVDVDVVGRAGERRRLERLVIVDVLG